MENINIKDLNKADVLAALFNYARTLGLGKLHYQKDHLMDRKEAEKHLKERCYFDYLEGRVMKIDLSGDELNPALYDRDNGRGAALYAIEKLRKEGG